MTERTKAEEVGSQICAIAHDQYDYAHKMKELLEENSDLDLQDYLNEALILSTRRVCYNEVKLLLEYGADPNYADSKGVTALIQSCDPQDHWTFEIYCGRNEVLLPVERTPEIVKILLEYGADPNAKNIHGTTAMLNAECRQDYTMVQYLREYGAKSK